MTEDLKPKSMEGIVSYVIKREPNCQTSGRELLGLFHHAAAGMKQLTSIWDIELRRAQVLPSMTIPWVLKI